MAGVSAVGASDDQDRRLWLSKGIGSNYGPCVDLFGPGRDIISSGGSSDGAYE